MTEMPLDDRPGLTIIVVTYRRMEALYANLSALLAQDLRDIPSELIIVNNDSEAQLRPSRWTKLGRLFRDNPAIRLVNSRHNWKSIIRFSMVYMARYDTVLILDDDITLQDNTVAYDMYQTLMRLEKYDIVSCWNYIWTHWTDSEYHSVAASFKMSNVTELTKTDTCGSGISMFNKDLIFHAGAQKHLILRDRSPAGDMALGLLSNMLWGGTTYAMPMYRRARFHPEWEKYALHQRPKAYIERGQLYKAMLQAGYKPLITREPLAEDSPEMKLINRAEPWIQSW